VRIHEKSYQANLIFGLCLKLKLLPARKQFMSREVGRLHYTDCSIVLIKVWNFEVFLQCKKCVNKHKKDSINYQQYALICTAPLFYVLAPTCSGCSLPSTGNFLDPSELLEI
jgi:hypothetical protein